jgi:hypothetical protein
MFNMDIIKKVENKTITLKGFNNTKAMTKQVMVNKNLPNSPL